MKLLKQRLLLAATATLALLAGCQRETMRAAPQAGLYYLNGQPSTKQEVDRLPAETIDRMDVLSGQQARTYARDSSATSVVLVKTKQPYRHATRYSIAGRNGGGSPSRVAASFGNWG